MPGHSELVPGHSELNSKQLSSNDSKEFFFVKRSITRVLLKKCKIRVKDTAYLRRHRGKSLVSTEDQN